MRRCAAGVNHPRRCRTTGSISSHSRFVQVPSHLRLADGVPCSPKCITERIRAPGYGLVNGGSNSAERHRRAACLTVMSCARAPVFPPTLTYTNRPRNHRRIEYPGNQRRHTRTDGFRKAAEAVQKEADQHRDDDMDERAGAPGGHRRILSGAPRRSGRREITGDRAWPRSLDGNESGPWQHRWSQCENDGTEPAGES